ncbi:MAG: hypothetical protein FJ104_07275 [Deltaproteobacteria bacterium]|nr:hypothetical protein [Deltaproteobacteria bacterium]
MTRAAGQAPPPLLSLEGARIDHAGAVLAEQLTFTADGEAVALVGDFDPLFRVLAGEAQVTAGRVEILGAPAEGAVRERRVGLAPADLALPEKPTVLDWLEVGVRASGVAPLRPGREARRMLERLGVGALGPRPLGTLHLTERRALAIVAATLGDPPVLAVERPLEGLGPPAALSVERLMERAAEGRRLLTSFAAVPGGGRAAALVARMDTLVVRVGPRGVAVGAPGAGLGPGTRYVVHVSAGLPALGAALDERGIPWAELGPPAPHGEATAGAIAVTLALPGETGPLVDALLESGAELVELSPVARVPAATTPGSSPGTGEGVLPQTAGD